MVITFKNLGNYGRIGNSLFQAATTIALAKRNNDSYLFPLWNHSFHFNIPQDKFRANLPNVHEYNEIRFPYTKIPYHRNMNIHGYFQSDKYFKDNEVSIRNLLTPKYSAKCEIRNDTASIHVRRGDYLSLINCYEILDMSYYEPAMESSGVDKFIVFSDDISWCKKHFKGNQFEFSEGNSGPADLAVMSSCSHNIIANSSFSWWGAWLNRNADKKIIAPNKWFGPKLAIDHPTQDLIPEDWIKV